MQLGIRNVASALLLSVVACATDHETMPLGRDADILLERLHQAGDFSGAVIIGHNGEIVYENAFGNADKTRPFTPDTAADGGSLAKTVTAALIWRLIDAGTIALDDPVQDHVAEFPYAAVTIEHLLSHRCCQFNANPSPLFAGQQVLDNEKFAPFAKGDIT